MDEMVSYVIVFGISIVLVLGMIVGFVHASNQYQDSFKESYAKGLCYEILDSVSSAALSANDGFVYIRLPEKIGGSAYDASLSPSNIIFSDINGKFLYSCRSNYDISGKIHGGLERISFADGKFFMEDVR